MEAQGDFVVSDGDCGRQAFEVAEDPVGMGRPVPLGLAAYESHQVTPAT